MLSSPLMLLVELAGVVASGLLIRERIIAQKDRQQVLRAGGSLAICLAGVAIVLFADGGLLAA